MQSLLKRKFWGISGYEMMASLAFYFFFAYLYTLTLWINRLGAKPDSIPYSELFSIANFLDSGGLQYLVFGVFSLPIWWLIFRKFNSLALSKRLLIHLITLPIWVMVTQQIYYALSELVGFWHLDSYGQVWDIYIPILFYILQFGILHAYEYYHTNQRIQQQKAALSQAALKSELSALKAQLNPHFLYNVFNTISASVPSENEETRELIAKLSDLFRYQLQATKAELVPLRAELNFVEKYLDLEKARFENRLQVHIQVEENIKEELIPPMILQPLVENSLKHGLSSLIEGGEVLVRIERQGEKIQFEVADTGIGVKDKSAIFNTGLGLTNTKLRLEKRYQSELKISDNQPRGLKIEFTI